MGSGRKDDTYIVGDKQARMHQNTWWTFKLVRQRALRKIEANFKALTEELARWLDGQGTA